MIEVLEKDKCCGCQACVNVCPKECITMKYDEEGYIYPIIDTEKCIKCDLCKKVCHLINKNAIKKSFIENNKFYAAYNKDYKIMENSSSGGIFWLLAKSIINVNGIVYGAEQTSIFSVKHKRAETLDECVPFRGSKYLQSNINKSYKMVKEDLLNNKKVLFSGTPCQVAGLYSYLGKEYENLYTCDVVCHGVPSMRVFKKYIKELEESKKKKVTNIIWRDKSQGWGPIRICIYFDDGEKLIQTSQDNMFQLGFLDNVYLRPSCYKCKYAKLPRISDISLADFWGYEGELKNANNNRVLSIVILCSEKGIEIFNSICKNINYHEVCEEYVKSKSRHVYTHPLENYDRENFFKDFNKCSFHELTEKYIKASTLKGKLIKKIRKSKEKFFRRFIKEN